VRAVFTRVERDLSRLDVLVNNTTAVPELSLLFAETPFWEVPAQMWDDLFDVGLRLHFVASAAAAPLTIGRSGGLIVSISAAGAIARIGAALPYGVAKAALDRMTVDMAEDLRPHHVTAPSLWPPPTSTPGMLAGAGQDDDPGIWSIPEFTGRVIAALAHPSTSRGPASRSVHVNSPETSEYRTISTQPNTAHRRLNRLRPPPCRCRSSRRAMPPVGRLDRHWETQGPS
jgi:NAD(P)-dependent dehydrogenase (short-subunit alcohol dehydrogenase family)